ncbi:hypothetical protein GCM10009769_27620 [Curtobacterium luteum]|uniref:Uncharacterized protein n=1 Tax=Curtobacterium luteum TaxID=33881 RepID=A0A8H9KZ35_9MICO|nr:hypothetical protein GCM10009769_27620 [Curtobacterium luteum]
MTQRSISRRTSRAECSSELNYGHGKAVSTTTYSGFAPCCGTVAAATLAVRGAMLTLPQPPIDNAVRFDLTLAATRFGRGANAIGLHLTLGG